MTNYQKKISSKLFICGIVCFVFIIWLSSWFLINMLIPLEKDGDLTNRGLFGDQFGAVNALFSGLAFAGLIYTIYLQRHESKEQKKSLYTQNFENTFFQLLNLLNESVIHMKTRTHEGRACFDFFYQDLLCAHNSFSSEIKNFIEPNQEETSRYKNYFLYSEKGKNIFPESTSDEDLRKKYMKIIENNPISHNFIEIIYKIFYKGFEDKLGHYFRTLYNIIKFVDESVVEKKKSYTNLVRAQLSSYEILLLFYNCQSTLGGTKFKALVEKYALFKSLPLNLLFDPQHKSLYQNSAYGE